MHLYCKSIVKRAQNDLAIGITLLGKRRGGCIDRGGRVAGWQRGRVAAWQGGSVAGAAGVGVPGVT